MSYISEINYLGLGGYTLRTFLTVLKEVSVSKAAIRLGVSQSAVSHTLDKLGLTFNDPLFVREGRGIIATAKALSLRDPIVAIIFNIIISKNYLLLRVGIMRNESGSVCNKIQ